MKPEKRPLRGVTRNLIRWFHSCHVCRFPSFHAQRLNSEEEIDFPFVEVSSQIGYRACNGGFGACCSMIFCRSLSSWIGQIFSCMGGCLGCYNKPTPITAVDEPSKGLKIQGQSIRKTSITEEFWSTSTYEMENSVVQSQRSISSISISTQTLDSHCGSGSTSNPSEFVNHGLLLWNQIRQQWVGNKRSGRSEQVREPRLSWNATYESLLGTNKLFPRPIPLPEMVDFLVDVWEQEGLYD
ncbi:hypothetical protein HPP92_022872 [Vanilla planifolia]|uniref:Gag1-like clamp domain-containing protein n=1 Tax=Vanilla planifolia TaxID=51239 RepID=A0A835UE84_VANPL|nr:hypothetical protein HPP92_022872 [Vanilla planifolia]